MQTTKKSSKPEDDVLYKSIPGTGPMAILKRFYRDLFMLSYSSQRSRHYLVTFQAMAKERARHFRRYSSTIHPFSDFRCFWEYFMVCVCITKMITLGYNTSIFLEGVSYPLWYCGFLSEFFTIVDLFVSAKTGYVDNNSEEIVLDPKFILIKFFSSKVCFYALGSIPLHVVLYLRNGLSHRGCSFCNTSLFVTIVRFFGTLGIPRYYDATVFLEREESHHFIRTAYRRFVRIIVLALMTFHWIWCVHHCVYMLEVHIHNKVEVSSETNILLYWYSIEASERPHFMFLLLHDICEYVLLQSMYVEMGMDVYQKFTVIVGFLAANVFSIWCFMVGFDVAFQILFTEERLMKQDDRAENMFSTRQLPDFMTKKVKSYYRFSESEKSNIEEVNSLYAALPISVKNEIALHCYRRHFNRVPFFGQLPTKVLNDIVLLMENAIFMTGDVIVQKGIKGDGLLIIDKGVAAVYAETGEELEHLIDGDYFDLLSLFSDEEFHGNTVIAVLTTKVLFLDKHRFRKLMTKYPDQFFRLRHKFLNSGKAR